MAKITAKSDLTLGTNYKFHLVDFQGTDIAIDATGGQLTSITTDFTASSEVAGIVKRAIEVGDILRIANVATSANEGVELTVTSVAANAVNFTVASGAPVDEAAGADINITAFRKTFQFLEAGALSFVDGVAAIAWASEVVDQWDTGDLDIYDRIFTSVEPRAKALACLNGWEPHDADTTSALRDMALEIRDTATSAARRVYACARSGSLDAATDQFNFWPATDAEMDAPTAAVTTGYINQLILIFDSDNAVDNRGIWTFRCLEPGKTHLQEEINLQYAEIYPVASNNGIDPKLADPGTGAQLVSDGTVSAGGIYANILLNVDVDSLYDGDVNGSLFSFTGYVDADSQSNEAVHTKIHYLLRQPVNINSDGTGPQIRGDKAPPITVFSGDLFSVLSYYLLNYAADQRNNLQLVDTGSTTQKWPAIFSLTVVGPAIAQGGTFSLIHEDTFGASAPTYLQDETGTPQKDISISASHGIVIAYSTYNVDSHTPNTPIPLRLTWNRPGFIEPDNFAFSMGPSNQQVTISAVADPSYSVA